MLAKIDDVFRVDVEALQDVGQVVWNVAFLVFSEKSNEHLFLLQQSLLRNPVLNYSKCFSESGKGHISLNK